jgi:transcriptional regulator with XRE-family HTH domain
MASDGTPELAAIRCGEAIARLRTLRGWTRTQLLTRLFRELAPSDPYYESVSETWLARLENGRMVKVPRQTVEALCRALRCNPRERAWVLLHADRNVLAEPASQPTPAAEALTFVMERLYAETHDSLNAVLSTRATTELCELELFELAAAALEQALARRRRAALSTSVQPLQPVSRGIAARAGQRVS